MAEGFTRPQLERVLSESGIELVRISPVWFLTALMYNFPYVSEKLVRRKLAIGPGGRRAAVWLDKLLLKIPVLKDRSLFLCTVGAKNP